MCHVSGRVMRVFLSLVCSLAVILAALKSMWILKYCGIKDVSHLTYSSAWDRYPVLLDKIKKPQGPAEQDYARISWKCRREVWGLATLMANQATVRCLFAQEPLLCPVWCSVATLTSFSLHVCSEYPNQCCLGVAIMRQIQVFVSN